MTEAFPARNRPATPEEPGLEPPDSTVSGATDADLQADLFESLVESADYVDVRKPLPARSGGALQLATPEAIRDAFVAAWEGLSHSLSLRIGPNRALDSVRDLVLYDIPDGTRSTLSVPATMDVETDAGMYCLALVHTLASLGAQRAVLLTHTIYNRERGPEDTKRFLEIMAHGVEPFRGYARRHKIRMNLHGMHEGYELSPLLSKAFPPPTTAKFDAHFLLEYEEEWFLTEQGRALLEALPEIDVVVRHTKLQVSGGWIPIRMRKSAYLYSQNGSLNSNWSYDEYAAMVAVACLAKLLHSGEALSKKYVSIDEIKDRYLQRELKLQQRVVRLKEKPRKLFVVGSPTGLVQVYL
ncbi:MAG TPA: hypothetical protein VEY12_05340 [Thermoplasmata archaeon]|nr:hypothetical protein [Thermoplasmata archaeon]